MSGRDRDAGEPSIFAELEAMQAMLNQISQRFANMARTATVQFMPIGAQRDILALQEAHRQLKLRRERNRRLRGNMFGEPAWDMLLDLFIAHFENRSTPVTSLCIASNVPATTALRYIKDLELHGEIESASDPNDGRRRALRLSISPRRRLAIFASCRAARHSRPIICCHASGCADHPPTRISLVKVMVGR